MGMFKFFDLPEKKPGQSLNTADQLISNQTYCSHGHFHSVFKCCGEHAFD